MPCSRTRLKECVTHMRPALVFVRPWQNYPVNSFRKIGNQSVLCIDDMFDSQIAKAYLITATMQRRKDAKTSEHKDGSPKDLSTDGNQTDRIRWIDTSAMFCDPLTKVGSEKFNEGLETSLHDAYFDITQIPKSIVKEMRLQKARQAQKAS
eukprot:10338181-Karenia_brevis.AAC.1